MHVIKTGCRPPSLSLSPCVLAHLYSLISSQVAIKSCTAAKTAQIPASKPGPWLAGSEQALALTGPTLSRDRGPIGLFAEFFCKLFIQRGADRCLCTAEAIGRVTRTECVRKKSKWPQFQIFAKQRLNGASCQRSEPGVTFQILRPRKILAVSTKRRSFANSRPRLQICDVENSLSSKYIIVSGRRITLSV